MANYIYILINASMPGFLKIGMTTRSHEERASELSQGSGVPTPYLVAYADEVADCRMTEQIVHAELASHRANRNREFFYLPLKDAIRTLSQITDRLARNGPAPGQLQTNASDELQSDIFVQEVADVPASDIASCDTASAPAKTATREKPTEQQLVGALSKSLQQVYGEMRSRAIQFGTDVEVYTTRKNIVFKASRMFAEIQGRQNHLRVLLLPEGFDIPENSSSEI